MQATLLAVNGTLMSGLQHNYHLVAAGGKFVANATTDEHYRLWSINDLHPAMIRSKDQAAAVELELWQLPNASLADLLTKEPAGLSIGKVKLSTGETVLGVLGEPWLLENQREITEFGGWRNYLRLR